MWHVILYEVLEHLKVPIAIALYAILLAVVGAMTIPVLSWLLHL
jgi:hypothetical protein